MAFVSAIPVASSARVSLSRCAVRPAAAPLAVRLPRARVSQTPRMEFELSEGQEFKLDLTVFALAIAGWVVPSSIPTNIPLTDGTGLSQAFFNSVSQNLAAFPKGPAQDDPFWLLMFLWHVGLFACMIFGTIGANLKNVEKP